MPGRTCPAAGPPAAGQRALWTAQRVADDGAGCDPSVGASDTQRGVGLSALRRRFGLDYGGRARLDVHTAPGAGFCVEITIPQAA